MVRSIDRSARLTLAATLFLSACVFDDVLDVKTPDLITPDNLEGARGAELFATGALGQFQAAFASGLSGQVIVSGLMADEFHYSGVFPWWRQLDSRLADDRNQGLAPAYAVLHAARVGLENAADRVKEFLPGSGRLAEMHNLAGYTYVFFGEHYCSGVPYGRTSPNGESVHGKQQRTEQTFAIAIERFASAAASATSSDQKHLAAVGTARTLLNLGQYARAANEVAAVPTGWTYLIRSTGSGDASQRNAVYDRNRSRREWSLSDGEGGTGVRFRSNADARLGWFRTRMGANNSTPLFEQTKYDSFDADVVLASGIEARLIEAEAALKAGDAALWMTRLNALRATLSLGNLTDPGTTDARIDLLFAERARWLFGTAHRLGDLRRLVRQYGRSAAAVFPTGPYHYLGGVYGDGVNFPIPNTEQANPNFTGCFDRGA